MWRYYARELPAVVTVLLLATAGIWIAWRLSDLPDQQAPKYLAVVTGFVAPVSKTGWARRDPTVGVIVQINDGSSHTVGAPMTLAQYCRVGDRITLRKIKNNAGSYRYRIAGEPCARPGSE